MIVKHYTTCSTRHSQNYLKVGEVLIKAETAYILIPSVTPSGGSKGRKEFFTLLKNLASYETCHFLSRMYVYV